eukprot:5890798-Pyramimonas_sp.AAC.2
MFILIHIASSGFTSCPVPVTRARVHTPPRRPIPRFAYSLFQVFLCRTRMLCADTLRSTNDNRGSGKPMRDEDKDEVERAARALGLALDTNRAFLSRLRKAVGSADDLEVGQNTHAAEYASRRIRERDYIGLRARQRVGE